MNFHNPNVGLRSPTVSTSDKRGVNFIRAAIALGVKGDNAAEAEAYAARRWGEGSEACAAIVKNDLARMTKTATPAASTYASSYAAPLVSNEGAAAEYFGLVLEQSVPGRMQGIRRVPFHHRSTNWDC